MLLGQPALSIHCCTDQYQLWLDSAGPLVCLTQAGELDYLLTQKALAQEQEVDIAGCFTVCCTLMHISCICSKLLVEEIVHDAVTSAEKCERSECWISVGAFSVCMC